MFDNKYPYTDFHEMNLDWFLAKFKELVETWEQVQNDWNSLHDYVQNYFDNLNVQNEINNKLDAMVSDGTMADIVAPFVTLALPSVVDGKLPAVVAAQISAVVAAQIGAVVAAQLPAAVAGEVSTWLAAHVDPDTGYVIDDTLTITDAAADAKTVGDHFNSVIDYIKGNTIISEIKQRGSGYINLSSSPVSLSPSGSGWTCSVTICKEGDVFIVNGNGGTNPRAWAFLDEDRVILSVEDASVNVSNKVIIAPKNTALLVTDVYGSYVSSYKITKKAAYIGQLMGENSFAEKMTITSGKYIDLSGTTANINSPSSSSVFDYGIISCKEDDYIVVNASGGSQPSYAFVADNGSIIEKSTVGESLCDVIKKAPAGSAYLIINIYQHLSCGDTYKFNLNIAQVADKLDVVDDVNRTKIPEYAANKYINTSGSTASFRSLTSASGYRCLVADCKEGDIIEVTANGGATGRAWAFIDIDNNILDVAAADTFADHVILTAPTDSAWLLINDYGNNDSYIYHKIDEDCVHLAGETKRFTVSVNCNTPTDSTNVELLDAEDLHDDYGVLIFPDTYNQTGTPTRLIICCHGAGGNVSANSSQVEGLTFVQYLVANGYAVMDVNGLPADYATSLGVNYNNNVGSPIAIQSYLKAYHYIISKYNFYDDVFVIGGSMGGLTAANLCMQKSINIIANAAFCPVLDTYNEAFLNPWQSGASKVALGKLYDFDVVDGQYVYDADKVCGYNPMVNKSIEINTDTYTDYPVPCKFWHSMDDPTVSYLITQKFVDNVKRMGRTATLRLLATGGHNPYTAGDDIDDPSGRVNYRGNTIGIKPAVEEMFLWLQRYN